MLGYTKIKKLEEALETIGAYFIVLAAIFSSILLLASIESIVDMIL